MTMEAPGKSALITGGAGFIGSHLAELLLDDGWEVFVLDDLSTGSERNVAHLRERRDFHLIVDSVLKSSVVNELVHRCDVVFHLAAAVGVRLIVEQPVHTLVTNIQGTENVLDHCNRFGKRVLVASTSEVYGDRREPEALDGGEPAHLRADDRAALGVRGVEGDRRVPRARVPPGARARLRDRPPLQHRRPAPERAVRHGHPALRRGGARRAAARDPRRRHADALLLPRAGHDPRARRADGRDERRRRDLQRRLDRTRDDRRARTARARSDGLRRRRSCTSRTTRSTGRGSRTCSTASRRSRRSTGAIGWAADADRSTRSSPT